jgi:hypothetical protein
VITTGGRGDCAVRPTFDGVPAERGCDECGGSVRSNVAGAATPLPLGPGPVDFDRFIQIAFVVEESSLKPETVLLSVRLRTMGVCLTA